MTRVQDIMVACLLVGVMILAFCGVPGCAAAPPPRPKWSDRVPITAAVYLRGETWACSAVAIDDHIVMTAKHCLIGPMVAVAFPGIAHGTTVKFVHPTLDVALLTTDGAPLMAQARVATALPEYGDVVFVAGFGCYENLMVAPGLFIGVAPYGDLGMAIGVCKGDSGGPAFNDRGEVFGILSTRGVTTPTGFAVDVRGI